MSRVLGVAGKLQSGKNTTANFIVGLVMRGLGIVRGEFVLNEKGQLWISDLFGDESKGQGVFDITANNEHMEYFRQEYLNPYIKLYSYADPLKKMCIEILGLTYDQVYGTNEQKNSLTHLKWENMPGIISSQELWDTWGFTKTGTRLDFTAQTRLIYHEPGQMTAREVMQYVGTNIFRKMYGDVWVDATIRKVQADQSALAIITDVRFPNEVEGIQKIGGKVIRLTRSIKDDGHESEKCLDKDRFDWSKFDLVVDNEGTTITGHCKMIHKALIDLGWCDIDAELEKES